MVVTLLVAPAPAALAANHVDTTGSAGLQGATESAPVPSSRTTDTPDPSAGPRVRGGLVEEPPGATASVIIRLRLPPLSEVLLELRSTHGPQGGWGKAVLEDAAERLAIRDAALGLERRALNETLARAGVDASFAHDYRYLANAVNLRDIPASAVAVIAEDPRVLHVQRDATVEAMLSESVPLIDAPSAWNRTDTLGRNLTGTGSLIANIDTGVDYSHPALGGTLNRTADFASFLAGSHSTFAGGWDFVNSDNDPWDDHFHGTHVAGIIGANGTLVGVAPGSRQLALKVLSASGYGSSSNVIAAMEFATDPDRNPLTDDAADASSMSLGGWAAWPDDVEALAADASTLLGTLCVIAAGNSGSQLNTIG
ncbi:MAG: S8 family peptidase, partial [Candidatus Rokuibacteriota bacterium]